MESRYSTLVPSIFALLMTSIAEAYEFSTHAAITREAYVRSALYPQNASLIARLGLTDRQADLGDVYIDVGPNATWSRLASPKDNPTFGSKKIESANNASTSGVAPTLKSLAGWLMLGSIREDDVPWDGRDNDNTPQDDPNGSMARVLRHFFDPKYDAPLVVVGLINLRTPDWALGLQNTPIDNHFNLPAAREAMWRAATLTTVDSVGNVTPIGVPTGFPFYQTATRRDEALRVAYWATTFHALGSTVHLLQDMAQPQHTRNDPHSGLGCTFILNSCAWGHASYYEQYMEARATGSPRFTLKERAGPWSPINQTDVATLSPALDYGQYTPVKLATSRDYFASAVRFDSETGVGLANYSNQGFYTAGSNIGSLRAGSYSSPPPNANDPRLRDATLTGLTNSAGQPVLGSLTLKKGSVADHNDPTTTDGADVALSSFGIFDQFLARSGQSSFTLNHYNYDDQAKLLIPRAVGYSAGFLNRFFRGKLDLQVPDEGVYGILDQSCSACGFGRLKVKLRNSTPSEDVTSGVLVAVVLYRTYSGYADDLSRQPGSPTFVGYGARSLDELMLVSNKVDVSSLTGGKLASGAAQDVVFTFPTPIPINATDINLQVAFRGGLGNETDAVIVSNKDISEPTFFGFGNNTDYVWDLTGQRYVPLPFGVYTDPDNVYDVRVRFSTIATAPVATLPKLSVRQHAQLAVITDLGQQTAYYDYHTSSHDQVYPTVSFQYDATQFYSPSGTNGYDANVKVSPRRGVYRQNYAAFNYPRDDVLICLVNNERCTQSTLPTLSPADRVAWAINF